MLLSTLSAQTEKGNYLIGGSGDASLAFNYTTRSFNVAVQPTLAIFAIQNFAIGANFSFGVSGSHTINATTNVAKETNSFNTSLGPLLKYYIGKKGLKAVISANTAYLITTGIRTETNTGPSQALEGFVVGGSVGLAYFISPHMSLEPALYITATGYQTQYPTTRIGVSLAFYGFLDKKNMSPALK
ncbi:MAG: hypothetical protein JWO06_3258 [Bacteroidota bacterium]|nr:hypothetical protein [Bacteroidota bacterium]